LPLEERIKYGANRTPEVSKEEVEKSIVLIVKGEEIKLSRVEV
jgi:hypothetical protein